MAFSCTDFVDAILNDMLARGWIQPHQFETEDTDEQCDVVQAAIVDADNVLQRAAGARQFHTELLDAVETLTSIGEQHGPLALAHIIYLQMAILNGTSIEMSTDEAEALGLVRGLPSGDRWWKHVEVIEAAKR
jgi:hypothetical protein